MVDGIILISTTLSQVYAVSAKLKNKSHPFIKKVFATAGPYDLVVLVSAEKVSDIGHFVVREVQTVEGVSSTLTMVSIDN